VATNWKTHEYGYGATLCLPHSAFVIVISYCACKGQAQYRVSINGMVRFTRLFRTLEAAKDAGLRWAHRMCSEALKDLQAELDARKE
jgi:hypothetical protein